LDREYLGIFLKQNGYKEIAKGEHIKLPLNETHTVTILDDLDNLESFYLKIDAKLDIFDRLKHP